MDGTVPDAPAELTGKLADVDGDTEVPPAAELIGKPAETDGGAEVPIAVFVFVPPPPETPVVGTREVSGAVPEGETVAELDSRLL